MADTSIASAETLLEAEPIGMTVAQFAEATGVTRMTANRWVNTGQVPHVRINGKKIVTANPQDFLPPCDGITHRTIPQFAQECGVTRAAVYRWVSQQLVEHVKVNGKQMITSDPQDFRLDTQPGVRWTVPDFAAAAGVTRQTIYRKVDKGQLAHVLVNGKLRITADPAAYGKH